MLNYKIFYSFLLLILFPFLIIYLIFIIFTKENDWAFIKNRLGIISKQKNKNNVCIHCASLGEVNGAKELIKEILKKNNV